MEATELLSTFAGKQWEKVGITPHHGVDIPLFALHTMKSSGIGEFYDLIPFIDWLHEIGMDTLQLLPINDSGPDASPYHAISAFALNPIYISLADLPNVQNHPDLVHHLAKLQTLNVSPRIDYKNVSVGKDSFLRKYYDYERDRFSLESFISENNWVQTYALFKTLKIRNRWEPWTDWSDASLVLHNDPEVHYQIFLQFVCFEQMKNVKLHADKKNVRLMGDIPILIGFDSADVWHHRDQFIFDYCAGAPPDMFSSQGQNWGFPLYNWTFMALNDFALWKERLKAITPMYHMYRLDHIVGFFRIWAIGQGKSPSEGKFIPEDSSLWIPQGEQMLKLMLDVCPLLPIGEDLGVIPPEVRACMHRLGICGTKVMRWEKYWDGDHSFIPLDKYPLDSMTTVSTHDSETLEQWWAREGYDFAQSKGWEHKNTLSEDQRLQILWDSHHSSSLFHVNLFQEYLALFPDMIWGDDPQNERINVPGEVTPFNWTYRFKPSVEQIISHPILKNVMQKIIS